MIHNEYKYTWRTVNGIGNHAIAEHVREASAKKTVYLTPYERDCSEAFWTLLFIMGLAAILMLTI